MGWRTSRRAGAVLGFVLGCSSGPAAPLGSPPARVPAPSVSAAGPRHSPCEIAAALESRAAALRAEGRLVRAQRALAEAIRRCPERASALAAQTEAIEAERAPGSDSAEDLAKRADSLVAQGKLAEARRERERSLVAREKRAGGTFTASEPLLGGWVDLAWSPDGASAAILFGERLSIYDADLRDEQERHVAATGRSYGRIAWLHQRRAVAVLDLETKELRIVDLETKRVGPALTGHEGDAESLLVSPDDRYAVVVGPQKVTLFDTAAAKSAGSVALPATVASVAVSPTSSKLAVGLANGTARVFDLPARTHVYDVTGFESEVTPRFQSDARILVGGSGKVQTFDVASGQPIGEPILNEGCSPQILGRKADRLVWRCFGHLESENAPGLKRVIMATPAPIGHLDTGLERVSGSPDGSRVWYLASGGRQGILDTKTGKQLEPLYGPSWAEVALFRPDNRRIALLQSFGHRIWTDDRTLFEEGNIDPSPSLHVTGAGALMFADADLTEDPQYAPSKVTVALRPPGGDAPPSSQLAYRDGPLSYSAAFDRVGFSNPDKLEVFDLPKGTLHASIPLRPDLAQRATLAPGGEVAAVAGTNGIRLVYLRPERTRAEWSTKVDPKDEVSVSPGGARVVLRSSAGTRLWEVGRKDARTLAEGPSAAAFLSDDRAIVASTGKVVLLDLSSGKERSAPGPDGPTGVVATQDGSRALVLTSKGTWLVDTTAGTMNEFKGVLTTNSVFLAGGRVLASLVGHQARVYFFQVPSGKELGMFRRLDRDVAYYRAVNGNVETFGKGAEKLDCFLAPVPHRFSVCEDRHLEPGLLARTIAGRGCTVEDAGDVCD